MKNVRKRINLESIPECANGLLQAFLMYLTIHVLELFTKAYNYYIVFIKEEICNKII
jgi:hypothetical protein